ncbi:chromate transporter [Enterococcus sp. HY326]|uniref:chromate transporter n=1 Tax=Enterococcus sp. HY326 TaxID=2971265 RepID=UPI002240052B|nr:chromate transporter [Enterococcus sp. HY326]
MIWQLYWNFLKIGLFSIGGGYAIIPLIQAEVVEKNGWITQKVFTDVITISQMTPGPLAVNTSTFVGMQLAGVLGALVATLGAITAGVIISMALYQFFQSHQESVLVGNIFQGLKAASVGLIASAALTIILLTFYGSSELSSIPWLNIDFKALILFAIAFFALKKYKVNPILLMCVAGVIGLIIY